MRLFIKSIHLVYILILLFKIAILVKFRNIFWTLEFLSKKRSLYFLIAKPSIKELKSVLSIATKIIGKSHSCIYRSIALFIYCNTMRIGVYFNIGFDKGDDWFGHCWVTDRGGNFLLEKQNQSNSPFKKVYSL